MNKIMTSMAAAVIFAAAISTSCSNKKAALAPRQILFDNEGRTEMDFRIPAILLNAKGELVAFGDRRYSTDGADIGAGEIDIQNRISSDNGLTWDGDAQNPRMVADGVGGEGFDCAHGDAAVVCDRESGKILLLCASGSVGFPSGGTITGRYYSDDGGRTFTGGAIHASDGLPQDFDEGAKFFTSGRICQSGMYKFGSHYRLYSGAPLRRLGEERHSSQVMYSDDFGASWNYLGEGEKGCDESKIVELPNGSLLHSCRVSGRPGRLFNVFSYDDPETGKGHWGEGVIAEGITAASCNGEILLVPKGKDKWVLLQSVACSTIREKVGIYWKNMKADDPYTDPSWYNNWDGFIPVSDTSSCYSSMTLDRNGNIAFIWEQDNIMRGWTESYDIYFETIPLP